MRKVLCVLTVGFALALGAAPAARAAIGDLSQKAGTAGCVSETGNGGVCVDGKALVHPHSLAISADGKSAYASSLQSDALAIFDRDTATGVLTQKMGTAGCVSETGDGGACADGTALGGVGVVAVSPDGKSVYVSSSSASAITIFDRDIATGALTQKTGTAGCVSEDGTGGQCANGNALTRANSVTVSPDGKSVYATSLDNNAVTIFDRDASGALTQKPGADGCIAKDGVRSGPADNVTDCAKGGVRIIEPRSVAVSSDGKSAYIASSAPGRAGIMSVDRDVSTGALALQPGTASCINESNNTNGACVEGKALSTAWAITISADDKSVYLAARGSNAVAVFDRDTTTGALTQKAGTAGCVSETLPDGQCAAGTALRDAFGVTVSPDDKSVYVASSTSDAIAIFDRNTTTGALTQKTGTTGCVSKTGTGGACAAAPVLEDTRTTTISPDGNSLYATSAFDGNAVLVFNRASAGSDWDNDTVFDGLDVCPFGATGPGGDTDGDGCKDSEDADDDNDTVNDGADSCPTGATGPGGDTDGDGCKDSEDADDDNDTVNDGADNCPLGATGPGGDTDGDGCKNAEDADDDNDTVNDGADNCRLVANQDQTNTDGDAQGDACDADDDNDNVNDGADSCPTGAGGPGGDTDGDGCKDSEDADDDQCIVPAVARATPRPSVRRQLNRAHCALGEVTVAFRRTVARNRLIRLRKPAGKILPPETAIEAVFSKGPRRRN